MDILLFVCMMGYSSRWDAYSSTTAVALENYFLLYTDELRLYRCLQGHILGIFSFFLIGTLDSQPKHTLLLLNSSSSTLFPLFVM